MTQDANSKKVFWGCFIALITTSMAFSTRIGLVFTSWSNEFGLDGVQEGVLFGAGIWPFAISIILFSLIIDKIGYKVAMYISFACYALYGLFALMAYGSEDKDSAYSLLYAGSVILGLGNGTVEAFINPVVATLFSKEKTKWLNILHAGWPGGLIVGGLTVFVFDKIGVENWMLLVLAVLVPAVVFLIMLAASKFPVNERVQAGASYREMLAELGVIGAAIAILLICRQLELVLPFWNTTLTIVMSVILIAGYAVYARSFGRGVLVVLILIMIPLATTELGTDSWITSLMEAPLAAAGFPASSILVLVYTSAIMMVLRFNVGPVVDKLTPLGLLAVSSLLAIIGLFLLSAAQGLAVIFIAATIYALGKTFFWPTMLGVVSEQTPKGGALTLNAIAGIGMLSVGIIGGPLIGMFQESNIRQAVSEANPLMADQLTSTKDYILGEYEAIDSAKLAELPEEEQEALQPVIDRSTQGALAKITIFPIIMLIGYLGLILYFKSKGGYRPVNITDQH